MGKQRQRRFFTAAESAQNGAFSRRIEAVAEVDGRFRVLDLKKPEVREAVANAASAKSVYASSHGANHAA
jgi:type III restriction enzyme